MKIEDTELEYNEADGIVLDYWLGGDGETKEQWAQRVSSCCKEYEETDGKGYSDSGYGDKGMPPVYKQTAEELWTGKKNNRRVRFYQEMESKIKEPSEISDEEVIRIKELPKYSTRAQRDEEHVAEKDTLASEIDDTNNRKLEYYISKGRSYEDIILTHPELKSVLNKKKAKLKVIK